jgi:hypothetical protein
LREFSRRTTDELRAALPLRLALPALEPFLAENVAKEIRKDALVIRHAAAALAAGERPGPGAAHPLLVAAREVDRAFLARVGAFPVRIRIRYEGIEPLRLQRIELGLDTAYRILEAWQAGRRLRQAFAPGELQRRMFELLKLYARETLALSDSVQLPGILAPLRRRVAQRLEEAMMHAARTLTAATQGKAGRMRPFHGR